MKYFLPLITIILVWASSVSGSSLPSVHMINSGYRSMHKAVQEQPLREVELYPNPVTEDRLTITASDNIASVQILNITGKMVFNQLFDSNTSRVDLELDKLENGVYLVRIFFPDKEYRTEKIMVK